MATEKRKGGTIIEPGAEIQFGDAQPSDVPTYLVDGIRGIMASSNVTKFSFYEHCMDPLQNKVIRGRYILTLAIPNALLRNIADLIGRVADDNDADPDLESAEAEADE